MVSDYIVLQYIYIYVDITITLDLRSEYSTVLYQQVMHFFVFLVLCILL